MDRLFRALGVFGCATVLLTAGCGRSKSSSPTGPGAASQALHMTSTPVDYTQVGEDLKYQAVLSKPGAATWALMAGPNGAKIDQNGTVTWTPTADQGGEHDITVNALLAGESVNQTVHITAASTITQATGQVDPGSPNGALVTVDAPLSSIQGTSVQIAPGALPPGGSVAVTISSMQNAPVPTASIIAGLSPTELRPVDLGPPGLAFQVPVTVHLPVTAAVLKKGRPEIQTYDFTTGRWEKIKVISVDTLNGFVVGEIRHFSPYVVTPPSNVFNLQLGLGASGSACATALLVRPALAVGFDQIPASSVNGYQGKGTTAAAALAGLAVGEALQVYTRVKVQSVGATGEQRGWVLASASHLPTGKIKVNVTSDSHGSAFLTTPPELDATDPELFAWLSGGRVDLVFGGLGSLASGAIADADVSLYAVLASDADHLPPQSANAFGTDQVTQSMLMPMTDVDDDCDGAPNQWDPTPQGAPPPLLTGLPPGPVHVAVGSPATFKVAANQTGVTFTWAASDPSVAVTSAMGGTVAAATPGQPGLFHIDVVGSNGTTSARMSWDLIAEPPSVQAANTPPHVAIGASAMTVRAGERVVLNAYGKDAEQAQLTFAWFTDDASTLSAQLGSSVVFAAATPGDYKIGCVANDGLANSPPAVVVVSVISPTANRPPGPPVVTPTSVVLQHDAGVAVTLMLQASASDPDGDAVTYDFAPDRFTPPTFTLTKDGAVASFATTQDGLYLFYVTAQDSHGVNGAWTPVKIQVMPRLTAMPVDADKDGYPAGIDCNDNDPAVFPGAKEICGDAVDQNCDGRDLGAADCDADGDRFTTNQGDCDDHNPTISPGAIERCDGIDNNCNGKVDEGFGVGVDCSAGAGACRVAATTVCNASFNGVVCGGKPGQPQPETCDGVDNDCNGQIDDVSDTAGGDVNNCGGCNVHCKAPANGVAACLRGGCTSTCAPGWVDTDHNPDNGCECQVSNGGVEICDGVDNDCNGSIDDGGGAIFYDGPAGSLGIGVCRSGARSCQGGQPVTLRAQQLPMPEICDGLDNDCNGTVDDGFDLTKDPRNCGGCGIVCADGKCEGGKCTGGVIGPMGDGGVVDSGGDAGTGPGMGTFVICNGATGSICTDLSWDPANCGACGRTCPSGMSCGGGVCVDPASTCPSTMMFCKDSADPAKGYCTDPMNDPGNCGNCGNRCASGYCQAGVCQTGPAGTGDAGAPIGDGGSATLPTCDPTHPNVCPLPGGGGYCTNFMADPGNCGGCARTCPAGLACNAGQCSNGAAACVAPLSSCGTTCTSFGDDPANCGHCGNTCPGGVCQAALCASAGAGKFGDPCGSNTNCGAGMMCMEMARFGWPGGFCSTPCDASRPCGSGQSCVIVAADSGGFGTCRSRCATDTDCGGAGRGYLCSSGTCGPDCRTAPMACNKGQVCDAGGHCVPGAGGTTGCAAPLTTCMTPTQSMFCTDLSRDPANCGLCGKVCPASTVCNNGVCLVSSGGGSSFAGMAACTGTNGAPVCTNIYNDSMNCGACGVICQGGTYCQGGICAAPPTCPATNMLCGDPASGKRYCTDVTVDSANCGTCGVFCQGGTYCQGGTCVPGNPTTTCQPPYKTCSDPMGKMICLRVDSDPSNCGGCGFQCPAGAYCQNYTCVIGTTNPDGGTTQPPTCTDPMTKPCPNATGTGYYCAFVMGDPSNCGGCGYHCPSGVCQNYACVPPGTADGGAPPPDGGVTCNVPLFPCKDAAGNLACVDRSYDGANCGACGNVCPANTKCTNAQCVVIQ